MLRTLILAGALFAAPVAAEIQAANPFHDRLIKMAPVERDAVFRRTIRESGMRCGRVTRTAFQQRYKNLMLWRAECEPARSIAVYVGPDGSIQARDCADAHKLGLPACARLR